ncbi:CRISPR-associated endonuclease Cas6 [Desulfosarcina ovata]|uniref:DNA repair protein n=1 Tax=Desulfosarcina ovata subsp. ovata TaxID=2752305 RepID=A0A5K8AA54_9BACT|nr:CRISPR-associated endonuclease Cas6 [Desulfosarcina ovata]BBO89338.1 hypothetical protein DSCOOX_25180 [Desulfosarcina ovata subsp. ovata]
MKIATLYFSNVRLRPSQIHKLRGYVGNAFKNHDLIHNHDLTTDKVIYRYPLIQFKLIDNVPAIISITERAIKVFGEIFMQLDHIRINGCDIPVYEKNLKVDDVEFGFSNETFMYEFVSPWIGLNQKNFASYKSYKTESERNNLLRRILVGNMLSMSKYLDVYLEKEQKITVDLKLKPQQVNLKGKQMTAFKGIFKTNFMIPDYLGLGKSVSRGFGTVRRML